MRLSRDTGGRPELDRKTPLNTWANQETHDALLSFAKQEGVSYSDVTEALAHLLPNPAFASQLADKARDVKNNNRKYPALLASVEPVTPASVELTPEEVYQHLDPVLKEGQHKRDVMEHFSQFEPLTLDVVEREEDKAAENLHQERLDQAKERATTGGSKDPFGPKTEGTINHARYAEELKLAREKKANEDRARELRRIERRALLGIAVALVNPPLRQPGSPVTHRQYEQPSHWATSGGATRHDLAEASRRAPKDTS